jgi:hypothetical protein
MPERFPWRDVDFVLSMPDRSGAVVVTTDGYALFAGTAPFIRACVPEGPDALRAEFGRSARKQFPALREIAERFPPRHHAWSSPSEAPPGTAVAEMVDLMDALVRGDVDASEFESRWLDGRRRAMAEGERIRGRFSDIMGDVFWAIEDHVEDLEHRDANQISGEELVARVRDALTELRGLR